MLIVQRQPDGSLRRIAPEHGIVVAGRAREWRELAALGEEERRALGIFTVTAPDLPPGKGVRNITFRAERDGNVVVDAVETFDWPPASLPPPALVALVRQAGLLQGFLDGLDGFPRLARRLYLGIPVRADNADLVALLAAIGADPALLLPRDRA